jgi:hypothetical protein
LQTWLIRDFPHHAAFCYAGNRGSVTADDNLLTGNEHAFQRNRAPVLGDRHGGGIFGKGFPGSVRPRN